MYSEYENCTLCCRRCGVNRIAGDLGFCKMGSEPIVSRIGIHAWEEPIISGEGGSGTIFFSGCSLRCVFCQNAQISRDSRGRRMSEWDIATEMLSLEKNGANNINFVTPTHYAKSVILATALAREGGLSLPVLYNTSSYDTVETIRSLKDTVNIFLPDFKYYLSKTASEYSSAPDYVTAAKASISEMVKIAPEPVIENGIMQSGVLVRILLLPSHVAEAKLSLEYLYKTYGNSIYISLMSQYTPMPNMKKSLDRRVTQAEYYDLVNYAQRLGVENAFIQELSSSGRNYIPEFEA